MENQNSSATTGNIQGSLGNVAPTENTDITVTSVPKTFEEKSEDTEENRKTNDEADTINTDVQNTLTPQVKSGDKEENQKTDEGSTVATDEEKILAPEIPEDSEGYFGMKPSPCRWDIPKTIDELNGREGKNLARYGITYVFEDKKGQLMPGIIGEPEKPSGNFKFGIQNSSEDNTDVSETKTKLRDFKFGETPPEIERPGTMSEENENSNLEFNFGIPAGAASKNKDSLEGFKFGQLSAYESMMEAIKKVSGKKIKNEKQYLC
ncbi:uncharacterized protein LOC101736169 isoform X2 [Bombyx mori]|uniref:Uncharacterized protein n=1 Tax=Bombyx mori TaxID=7091 RepID=A0A8R2GBN0_BOMMO|nr:uncharacterized protein LOC101736169 isoform X1 [Bombyx mori]